MTIVLDLTQIKFPMDFPIPVDCPPKTEIIMGDSVQMRTVKIAIDLLYKLVYLFIDVNRSFHSQANKNSSGREGWKSGSDL